MFTCKDGVCIEELDGHCKTLHLQRWCPCLLAVFYSCFEVFLFFRIATIGI